MRAITSASNIFRRKLCPGSHHAEAAVADLTDNAPADEGTLLHPFACKPSLKRDHLTAAQQNLLTLADSISEELKTTVTRTVGTFDAEPAVWTNTRLDLFGPDNEKLYDGEADVTFLWAESDVAAVQDFKLGFVEVSPAETNYQLASYAVMWSDYLQTERIFVAINQPRNRTRETRLTIAQYDKTSIQFARKSLAAIFHAASELHAPRIPGEEQCRFCKAKLFCDPYKARFSVLAVRPDVLTLEFLQREELHRLGIACKTAAQVAPMIFEEIRRRIEAGEMEGWELKDSGETRELTDIVAAYQELSSYFRNIGGFTGKAFTDCTQIQWTKLTALVRKLTGFTENRSKATINEILNPLILRKPKTPSPTPIK